MAWCAAAGRHAPTALARARHPPQATPCTAAPPPTAITAAPAAALAGPRRPPNGEDGGGGEPGGETGRRGGEEGGGGGGEEGEAGLGGGRPRMMRNGSDTLDPPGLRHGARRGAGKTSRLVSKLVAAPPQPAPGHPALTSPPLAQVAQGSLALTYRCYGLTAAPVRARRSTRHDARRARHSYGLRRASDPSFFEGRCAEIYLKKSGQVVGLLAPCTPRCSAWLGSGLGVTTLT